MRSRRLVAVLSVSVLVTTTLAGCYTLQAVRGQLEILGARRPIAAVRADPTTDARTVALLAIATEARDLARRELGLARSGSYAGYAALPREWPVWSVVVAPEFDVEPRRQCFVFIGCLAYRGFFAERDALAWAARARARGDDAFVAPVPAYSTLGWFDDPVLWSMLRWDEATLAGFVAHELAHEALYTGDDTAFDEAFAEVVGAELVQRMFAAPERGVLLSRWSERRRFDAARDELLQTARADLARLYAGRGPAPETRAAKQVRLGRLRDDLAALATTHGRTELVAGWRAQAWDNARLVLTATYSELVPAFEALLEAEGGDLARFRARATVLARSRPDARRAALAEVQRARRAREP